MIELYDGSFDPKPGCCDIGSLHTAFFIDLIHQPAPGVALRSSQWMDFDINLLEQSTSLQIAILWKDKNKVYGARLALARDWHLTSSGAEDLVAASGHIVFGLSELMPPALVIE